MNLSLILQMAADAMPDRVALTSSDDQLTYGELQRLSVAAAKRIGPNRKIAYVAENSAAAPIALFGAALAGVPYVPINYRLAPDRVEALLRRVGPCLLVGEADAVLPQVEQIDPAAFLADLRTFDGETAHDMPEEEGGIAVELFTSGTTGEPKAAILRHNHLLAYILGSVEFMAASEDEAALVTVPPYHIAGVSTVLSSTYAGRRTVQLPSFTPEAWIDLAEREDITQAFLVPTMLQRIVAVGQERGGLHLPALRSIAYGGGRMPLSVIEAAMEMLPDVAFTNAYGLTETSSTIALLGPDEHRVAAASTDPAIRRRLASVGKPLPELEIEIRTASGARCETGETGDLYVRGEQVSGEYAGGAAKDRTDGWFATRDRACLDADGFLFLDGRADDVIVRGGENISPGEIEDVLASHPAVQEAAAVGIPDDEWGEAIGVAVVLRDGMAQPEPEELIDHIRAQLRSSRIPGVIRFIDQLPYNEMGKLLRREIGAILQTSA